MAGSLAYHLAALPALDAPGSTPELQPAELLEMVADHPRLSRMVSLLCLHDDLLQREGFLNGELREVAPLVLTSEQARNEAPLPAELAEAAAGNESAGPGADRVWEAYFRQVRAWGRAHGSVFLPAWAEYEVGLRNALVATRARKLGLRDADFRVADDIAEEAPEVAEVAGAWSAAETAVAAYELLARARWEWLCQNDRWFSFRNDELAAYAAKLLLLEGYRLVHQAGQNTATASATT